ncbi:hypothetical protein Acor_24360 [Acrocarpospora corrugata]|uniref:PIN domain-containing protein n=1 Tax=Acrocarpospora corrugata TaxID=35763 RepID=A0A5M3VXE6_9ACTN|nr:hypothetical protein [Acrocarpospora corrugata]GES00372.1 hypothetical protein Acor_24360 [Acrocarpospora corrugata]
MSDHTPTPYILDTSVLQELVRGDGDLISLIQDFDRTGQPMVAPVLAVAGALLANRGVADAEALLAGLSAFGSVVVAPLDGVDQAADLIDMISATGLDPWDAHVAAIANISVCPILTMNAAVWQDSSAALEHPLHTIEIAEPDN